MNSLVCRICAHAEGNRSFTVREMMFGTREVFSYFECAACGCVQIAETPTDLGRHYPPGYVCHQPTDLLPLRGWMRRLKRRLRWRRVDFELGVRDPAAWLGRMAVPWRQLGQGLEWINQPDLGITRHSRVLDVGAGMGGHLLTLASLGFPHLLGVDPFIPGDLELAGGAVWVRKMALDAVEGEFDLIMLHHSFEHVPEPGALLAQAVLRLAPAGLLVLRVPVAGMHAWRVYGADWVQLDAPRHQFLFSPRAMDTLARQHGLTVVRTVWDSYAVQFWGSEQYRRDIPLKDPRSVLRAPPNGPFTAVEMEDFQRRSSELNAAGDGDQAAFFLRRA